MPPEPSKRRSNARKAHKALSKAKRVQRRARDADESAAAIIRAHLDIERAHKMYDEARLRLLTLRMECIRIYTDARRRFTENCPGVCAELADSRAEFEHAARLHLRRLRFCADHDAHADPEVHAAAFEALRTSGRLERADALNAEELCIAAQRAFEAAGEYYEDIRTSASLQLQIAETTRKYCHLSRKSVLQQLNMLAAGRTAWSTSCQLLALRSRTLPPRDEGRREAVEASLTHALAVAAHDAEDKQAQAAYDVAYREYRFAWSDFKDQWMLDMNAMPAKAILKTILSESPA